MPRDEIQVNGRVTIFDVAEASGVSYGTVSRVINNEPHVRASTRRRVMDAIDRLGCVINRQAPSLARGQTHVIGGLVPLALQAVESVAEARSLGLDGETNL